MSGHRKAGSGAPYWVCACGGWTWADRSSCHGCGRRPDPATAGWLRGLALAKPGPAQKHGGARGDGGSTPTEKATLEEWMVQPRGKRNQARARARAAEATEGGAMASARAQSLGRRAAPAPAPAPAGDMPAPMECQEERGGEDQRVDPPNLDGELLPDAEVADAELGGWALDDADEQMLAGWIKCIEGLPGDAALARKKRELEAKLNELRRARLEKGKNPTLQLLRAQALTRRREKQRDAALAKVESLENQLASLQTQLDEARLDVARTEANLDDAKAKEETTRAEVAPAQPAAGDSTMPADGAEASLRDLMGLWAQLEALPAAAQAGNLASAHEAILGQARNVIVRFTEMANPAEAGLQGREEQPPPPEAGAGAEAQQVPEDKPAEEPMVPDGDVQHTQRADDWAATPQGEGDYAPRRRSGRRGASPARSTASARSRSRGEEEPDDEESLLRRAAQAPGQKRLDAWFERPGTTRG